MRSAVVVAMMLVSAASFAGPVGRGVFDRFDNGQPVRVWTRTHVFTGEYRSRSDETVMLATATGITTIALADVELVEEATTPVLRMTLWSAGVGALVGVTTPFSAELLLGGGCCHADGDVIVAATVIFTSIGAVVGALMSPGVRDWETIAGGARGTRTVGSSAPPFASLAVHGGASLVGQAPPAFESPMGPSTEPVKSGRLSLDVTLSYRNLVPAGRVGVSVLFTTFERHSDISPAPKDEVFVLGPEYRYDLWSGQLAPYLGAGVKYVTSETSTTTRGQQRALGLDGIAGLRWTPDPHHRLFLEAEARAVYGAVAIEGDTRHRLATLGAGMGVVY